MDEPSHSTVHGSRQQMFHGLGVDLPKLPGVTLLLSIQRGDMIDALHALHRRSYRRRIA
jgi:hypothetical protein